MLPPRYVRFARALALVGGASVGIQCASSVGPDGADTAVTDGSATADVTPTRDTAAPPDVAAMCPASMPGSGSPCPSSGQRCDYVRPCYDMAETFTCTCGPPGSSALTWSCTVCEGPLPPPDLAYGMY